MSETIICTIVTGISTVVVAVVGAIAAHIGKSAKDRESREEQRENVRREESLLHMEMQDANTQLTIAIANALLGGHNNGNVEKAYKAVEATSNKYKDFTNRIVARHVAK